jgi:hypothetical protein
MCEAEPSVAVFNSGRAGVVASRQERCSRMDEKCVAAEGVACTPQEDVLSRAADDWVHPGELLEVFLSRGVTDPQLQRLAAIGLVASLVSDGLVVVGDVGESHVPWTCEPGEAVLRVAREWMARADPDVMPGELFWLDCTPKGQALGEAVSARERGR